jgi:hypothetical protein
VNSVGLGWGLVVGYCKYGDVPSDSSVMDLVNTIKTSVLWFRGNNFFL